MLMSGQSGYLQLPFDFVEGEKIGGRCLPFFLLMCLRISREDGSCSKQVPSIESCFCGEQGIGYLRSYYI